MNCRYCGAQLRSEASIAAGYGPECARRLKLPTPERLAYLRRLDGQKQRMAAIFGRPGRRRAAS